MLEVRVIDDGQFETMQGSGDTVGFEAGDHDDGADGATCERCLCNARDHGFAVNELQELVALPHARGAPGGEHDGRDSHFRPLPRCTAVISAMIETAISA